MCSLIRATVDASCDVHELALFTEERIRQVVDELDRGGIVSDTAQHCAYVAQCVSHQWVVCQ